MRRAVLAAIFAIVLVLGGPLPSYADDQSPQEEPEELMREGVDRLMRALDALIGMIPQYELPEMNENGDIIIRRKRGKEPLPDKNDEPDQTQTRFENGATRPALYDT